MVSFYYTAACAAGNHIQFQHCMHILHMFYSFSGRRSGTKKVHRCIPPVLCPFENRRLSSYSHIWLSCPFLS